MVMWGGGGGFFKIFSENNAAVNKLYFCSSRLLLFKETVLTLMRSHKMQHLIRIYIVNVPNCIYKLSVKKGLEFDYKI